MSDARSGHGENWLVIGATAILVFVAHRYLQPDPKPAPAHRAVGPSPSPGRFARELAEPDRGRRAHSPLQIPLAGWKDILWRCYQRIGDDRLLATAAGVVFYGLLAVFPTVTALVSFYGLYADP
jgi:membrane protein